MPKNILLFKEIMATPQQLLAVLSREPNGFFLDSSLANSRLGAFSFFGIDPFLGLTSKDATIIKHENGSIRKYRGLFFEEMRSLLARFRFDLRTKKLPYYFPFCGGAVGFLSYDAGFLLENIPRSAVEDVAVPDAVFAFFDVIICIDHSSNAAYIVSCGLPEQSPHLRKRRAQARLKELSDKLQAADGNTIEEYRSFLGRMPRLESNFKPAQYLSAIRAIRGHIVRGDIYQLNLSQRFHTQCDLSDEQLYWNLRSVFPVPFGGIFKFQDNTVISGSPERFLRYDGRWLYTRPMKGTRPRYDSRRLDRRLRTALEKSPKDRAELLMIVDLERNDFGRVCDYGSVHVEELRTLEAYQTVFQTTAQIRGRLYPQMDRIDAVKACFPGGSITGCPKIRAMQIIEELEPNRRGIYTGSLGYFSFHNTMDFNILIRSFLKKGRDVYFGVGGGIVYDSDPEEEYEETLVKAEALKRALGYSQSPAVV